MFSEVIVVEGKNDEMKLRSIFPGIDTISTNGSEISEATLALIEEVAKTRQIILFLDPDHAGGKIRSRIQEVVPDAAHAFLAQAKAFSYNKKKIGIEHASNEDIIAALNNKLTPSSKSDRIALEHLHDLGIIGLKESKAIRDKLSHKLHLGHTNGKTFLKRVNMLGLSLEDLVNALEEEVDDE